MRTLVLYSALAAALITAVHQYAENKSRHLDADPLRVTAPQNVGRQLGVEAYGRYAFVLEPSRKIQHSTSLQELWQRPNTCRFTYTTLVWDGVQMTLDCHQCYQDGDVSGGRLTLQRGGQRWELGFHHVGAESVFYTDETLPTWARQFRSTEKPESIPDEFLKRFEYLYRANQSGARVMKEKAAKEIVSLLVSTIEQAMLANPTDSAV